uniref:Transglutaminase-like domain-containing protein n=1 Tax=Aplanochytrium stocchinoi TaxID=215587 RepID=A0A7S3LRB2_9STRA|mmetsp:Transcript_665/g.873  ORF Transcript_665/g.873 Transcript_665/m.873 type:complete len:393 (+) Transcript_665:82-1260(+)
MYIFRAIACVCMCLCTRLCSLGTAAIENEEAITTKVVYKDEVSVEAVVRYINENYGFVSVTSDENLKDSVSLKAARFFKDEHLQLPAKSLCGADDPVDCVYCSVRYLLKHMPESDVGRLSVEYIGENVGLALVARQCFPWASATNVPWNVFLNEVLPYASLAEPRDNWRYTLFRYMRKVVEASNIQTSIDAAIISNAKAWDIVSPRIRFAAAPPNKLNHYSPFEVMKTRNASCTGLSIFLTCALRSIGVPARVAGTPHWNSGLKACPHGDADPPCGNHNWVEVYAGKEWHFVNQAGTEGKLDVGWFFPGSTEHQIANSKNHSIFASSWADTASLAADARSSKFYKLNHEFTNFPMVWNWENNDIPGWDVTEWYHWKYNHNRSFSNSFGKWEF